MDARAVGAEEVSSPRDEGFELMISSSESPLVPKNYPKLSVPLEKFTFPKMAEEVSVGRKSFHVVHMATMNGKHYFIKFNEIESGNAVLREVVTQLEVVCWSWYRLLQPGVVAREAYPCYDNQFNFVAVVSEELVGFVPNRNRPLLMQHLTIETLDSDSGYQRSVLIHTLEQLVASLVRESDSSLGKLTSFFNYYVASAIPMVDNSSTALMVRDYLIEAIRNLKAKNTNEVQVVITGLIGRLGQRKNRIADLITYHQRRNESEIGGRYEVEKRLLDEALGIAAKFLNCALGDHIDIKKLEEIERAVRKKELELISQCAACGENDLIRGVFFNHAFKITGKELRGGLLLDRMDESVNVMQMVFGESFKMTIKDLKNYRLIKGLAKGMVQSWINSENDYHSRNGSNNGCRVDFDMSEWEFYSQFKRPNFVEWALKSFLVAATESFCFTEFDIDHFPDLRDSKRRYWPTETSSFQQLSNQITPQMALPFIENFYTTQENTAYKKLSDHPVFSFHKFVSILKNLLISEAMYRSSAELYMRADLVHEGKNILDELVKYKMARMMALKEVFLKMVSLREFFAKNGDYALALIKEEFEEARDYYRQGEHYEYLLAAIDMGEIEKAFKELVHWNAILTDPKNKNMTLSDLMRAERHVKTVAEVTGQSVRDPNSFFARLPPGDRLRIGMQIANAANDVLPSDEVARYFV